MADLLLVRLFVARRERTVQYIKKWVAFQIVKLETLQDSTHIPAHKIPFVQCWVGNNVGQVCLILITF